MREDSEPVDLCRCVQGINLRHTLDILLFSIKRQGRLTSSGHTHPLGSQNTRHDCVIVQVASAVYYCVKYSPPTIPEAFPRSFWRSETNVFTDVCMVGVCKDKCVLHAV